MMAFFALFWGMDSIEYEVGFWVLDVGDESMYEWVVAVVIDFDHKFIYYLNYFEQTKQYTTNKSRNELFFHVWTFLVLVIVYKSGMNWY